MKHPALRIASIADCDADFLSELTNELEEFGRLTPFADLITDFEVMGSYARGFARLGSDLDVNVATSDMALAKRIIFEKTDQFKKAIDFLKTLWTKYGVRIDVSLQDPTVKTKANKMCFSLRERKLYGTQTQRIPHLSFGVEDEHGNLREFDPKIDSLEKLDPYFSELPKWEEKYGDKLLKFGETPDTAWMK